MWSRQLLSSESLNEAHDPFCPPACFGHIHPTPPPNDRMTVPLAERCQPEGEGWDGGIWGTAVRVRQKKFPMVSTQIFLCDMIPMPGFRQRVHAFKLC